MLWTLVNPSGYSDSKTWPQVGRLCVVKREGSPFIAMSTVARYGDLDQPVLHWDIFNLFTKVGALIIAEQDDEWAYLDDV